MCPLTLTAAAAAGAVARLTGRSGSTMMGTRCEHSRLQASRGAPALTITGDASHGGDGENGGGDGGSDGQQAGAGPRRAQPDRRGPGALVVALAALVVGVVAFLRAGRRA